MDLTLDLEQAPTLFRVLCNEIGNTCYRVQYVQPAFDVYSEALPIYRELEDRIREADTLYNMAVTSYGMVSKQRALEIYSEALALYREVGGESQFEVILLDGLVDRHKELRQYSEALAVCEQLIQFERGRSSVNGEINGLVRKMLLLHENLKRPEEALCALDEALTLIRRRQKHSKMAQGLGSLLLRWREATHQNLSPNQRRVDTLKRFFKGLASLCAESG